MNPQWEPGRPPVPPALAAAYIYNALVVSTIDGDSMRLSVDRGDYDYSRWTIRLLGINARELTDPGGPEAAANLAAMLPIGTPVRLATVKPDKYGGRKLASVTFAGPGDVGLIDVATHLIRTGWAMPWDGRGPRPIPTWPRPTPRLAE